MRKTFKSFCKEINEASMLPNPANLKKPGIGPGSGQHSVGNMNVRSKSLSQAVADTGTYQAQSALNAPKLDTSKKVDTSNVKTPIMNNAVAQKTAADKAKAVATASKSPGAPAGGNYAGAVAKPHTSNAGFGPVATNAQLTAQANARKGFGAPAGGNYASAAKVPSSGAPKMAQGTSLNRPTGWNPNTGEGKAPVTAPANPMMGEKKPTNFAPGVGAAARRANMNSGGVGSSFGKNTGSGTTIKPTPKPGQAQAATPSTGSAQSAFDAQQRVKAAQPPSSMGAALKAAAARGEKTAKFGGKEYAVNFKDKAYQKKLATRAAQLKAGQAQRGRPAGVTE